MKNINIAAKTAFLLLLPLMFLTGCFSNEADYDEVQAQRDDYRARLQTVYQANDQLNQEISSLYATCEILSTQLAMKMAMLVHREYVVNLVQTASRQPPARQAPTTATTRQTPRTEGGAGGQTTTRPRTSASGGGQRPTATAPTPPPADPTPVVDAPRPPRGSIDWGN